MCREKKKIHHYRRKLYGLDCTARSIVTHPSAALLSFLPPALRLQTILGILSQLVLSTYSLNVSLYLSVN